jgi:glyoxylase-like metal-dependent hydrolase (beta-lactamase superfamily II)
MRIERWTGPPVETHAYLVIDEPSREAWVVDAPLDTAEQVLACVRNEGLRLARLVLTHGHFDHLLDVERYQAAGIPVAINPLERPLLEAPQPRMFGLELDMPAVRIDEELGEGTLLRLGTEDWEVWHVPGHSPGHVVLYNTLRATLLGGDLLFQGGYGRVDLPGSDPEDMARSLARVLELPDETRVYPGHGPETTVGAERPWLQCLVI